MTLVLLTNHVWTWAVTGLVIIPLLGLFAVIADLFDAYNDLLIVRHYKPDSVEEEQAKHTLWAQVARATILVTILLMAGFELIDVLTGNLTALLIYVIALVGVGDAVRARRARKRMTNMVRQDALRGS